MTNPICLFSFRPARSIAALAVFVFLFLTVLYGTPSVRAGSVSLYDGTMVTPVVYAQDSGIPIAKAAALLGHDLTALTGHQPQITSKIAGLDHSAIVIGLASSPEIAALLKANGVSTRPIDGKWETYGRAVIPAPKNPHAKLLVIFGSDVRGTIWGVIDITREMGVSAWQWWADVKIRHVDHIAVDAGLHYSKPPSVKYRGIFLNSSGLLKWIDKTFNPGSGEIGPKTYERIFQLMWRLKANTIWTSLDGKKDFNEVPGDYPMLKNYAIVRGTSHIQMLLRNNPREWDAKTMGPYDWLTNSKRMIEYWKVAVQKFGRYDNLYTVGLRGMDDFPMQGAKTPTGMAKVITEAIAAQRRILSNVLHKPADQIPQLFTPYKEVLAAYDTGHLKVPDDVTIDWPDDNFGYIMRMPDARERQRSGGSGVYYHLIFWGRPGGTMWLASTDPSLMREEMMKAYHFNVRRFWILNVGSIKPCEFLTQFYLAMAFDADAFKKPDSVRAYLHTWVGRNFGSAHQAAITHILWRYYKLAFDRNPEFMAWSTTFPQTSVQPTKFSILDYGDENARRADAYRSIMAQSARLMDKMPADRKAAFFQLVQYPVDIAGDLNLRQLDLDRSVLYGYQHRASANLYAGQADRAHQQMIAETRRYNGEENGKWRGLVFADPNDLPVYQAPSIPTWKNTSTKKRCGVQVEGGGYFNGRGWWFPTLPIFHRELGSRGYYLDIFEEQPDDATWSATPDESWIKLDHTSGNFSAAANRFEQRIHVSVDWAHAPREGEGTITVKCSDAMQPVKVHVRLAAPLAIGHASFIESEGVVSMYARHADERSGAWQVIDGLGHAGADLRVSLNMKPVDATDPAAILKAPHLVYRFVATRPDRDYSFPTNIYDETATIKAFALPTFPVLPGGGVRIAVSLDGGKPTVLNFAAREFGEKWRQGVLTNAAVARIIDQHISPGVHTLTVYALDPGVTLDRFEVDFRGASPDYGPIPETRIVK